MNITIKLSTGKVIELTESEMKELFGLIPTQRQPWFEPIPVYPWYPNYPPITYNSSSTVK